MQGKFRLKQRGYPCPSLYRRPSRTEPNIRTKLDPLMSSQAGRHTVRWNCLHTPQTLRVVSPPPGGGHLASPVDVGTNMVTLTLGQDEVGCGKV
jgi:hypothetical protein